MIITTINLYYWLYPIYVKYPLSVAGPRSLESHI